MNKPCESTCPAGAACSLPPRPSGAIGMRGAGGPAGTDFIDLGPPAFAGSSSSLPSLRNSNVVDALENENPSGNVTAAFFQRTDTTRSPLRVAQAPMQQTDTARTMMGQPQMELPKRPQEYVRVGPLGSIGPVGPIGFMGNSLTMQKLEAQERTAFPTPQPFYVKQAPNRMGFVNPAGNVADPTIAQRPAEVKKEEWEALTREQREAVINADARKQALILESVKLGLGTLNDIIKQAFNSTDTDAARRLQERLEVLKNNANIELERIRAMKEVELAKLRDNLNAQVAAGALTPQQQAELMAQAQLAKSGQFGGAAGFLNTPLGLLALVGVVGGGVYLLTRPQDSGRKNPAPPRKNYGYEPSDAGYFSSQGKGGKRKRR